MIDKEENEIPLATVKGAVLSKVVEYMKYHADQPAKEIEKPLKVTKEIKHNSNMRIFFC